MSIAAQNSSPDVANPGVRPIMPVPGEAQILVTHTPQQFEELPVLTWLVEKVFHMMGVILFWGASGAGKTALLIDLILALVAGSAWAGRPVQQGSVLYCALEGRLVSVAAYPLRYTTRGLSPATSCISSLSL
ncbi:AAA family ATPase [Paenacidovorax monticola]|uniref:AAA family ATPase n=1 Tax=Paenacidovorax monticola TaxID=1926868 RepID=A0A7H0HKS5_9BURK|nr:AAA family ATPase [Paenacidovorax monticola]